MSKYTVTPVDEAIHFGKDEIIVSKTDLKGRLLYANDVFCRVAEMTTSEVIGKPHSIIRHPDMPRTIFKLLWETIQNGEEIFAFVKNMSKTGKYYWVIAHVTPSFDQQGQIIGYHSNRRRPSDLGIAQISGIYDQLLSEELKHTNSKQGLIAGENLLHSMLKEKSQTYSQFVWSIGE
ncbi:PAS domain-containing protein [Kordiimonas sp. SCSIO 12610]|uniref:PAS domain-containing protein n=1 Tax=Kordiimonas sp. SCSIO 12610 TaxID=2829597 RepID=UPI00210937E1|nr:PAS domain-containing protein [Kordiimonas sp. SCSIO 12610]UTW55417.1 PAS domain-containing protein [Kordiimonas sp. SCSIO 12610]